MAEVLEVLYPSGKSNHRPIATAGAFQVNSPEAALPWIEY